MNYSAINIQGNIISSEILEKIRTEDIRFQKPSDFNLPPNTNVRDEINLAWSLAVSNWNVFKAKREALKDSDSGTSETRKYWMLPLLGILGYETTTANAEIINDKSYAISHRATNKDGFPIHIIGINQSMDKRPEIGGTRLSPHALAQEYINNVEYLYALVSNGSHLRLVRDATRLSRLSYLEFNLEQIMDEGLYVEFALLYRALHASRMPVMQDQGADSILEFYHQEAIASGTRIRERLSTAVEQSIRELANGFLHHPQNEILRQQIESNKLDAKQYYFYTLRLVYRILFLLVIEERKLIYAEKLDEATAKKRSIYYDFYSLQRLTKLATKLVYVDPKKTDLWQSLLSTFALFEYGKYGSVLGIAPLGAGLFAPDALGVISQQVLDNECLLKVLRYLVTFENENKQQVRVNYADLDVEEFGSVYEGLLEYDPLFTDNIGQPVFSFVKGDARSSSGSHYTPEELVKPLIKHSLDYLIEDKLKEHDKEAGLLSLNICDVACGSGHILLSAARSIGWELACLREAKATGQSEKVDQPTPPILRTAVRDVIKNCIYGVDLNPLAVELCKVALWLEAHAPGEPLNFLDHHIKCGNAIVGLAHADELENGITTEAFKTLPGDDKDFASALRKTNEAERKAKTQLGLYNLGEVDENLKGIQKAFADFKNLPEQTPEQIAQKEKAYQGLIHGAKWWRIKQLADLQVAQFFIPKTTDHKEQLTTDAQYVNYLKNGTQITDRGASLAISEQKHFFHWFLEFPEVFAKGGFDCILGNPPYLGGGKISSIYGHSFLNFITSYFEKSGGQADFVVYFLRRYYQVCQEKGFVSIITTNSISEGETRLKGIQNLLNQKIELIFVIKSIKWPGEAKISVSLFSFSNSQIRSTRKYINNKEVKYINSFFEEGQEESEPMELHSNNNNIFMGVKFLGDGFLLTDDEASAIIVREPSSKEVIFDLLNGRDVNEKYNQFPSRKIINFFDWSLEKSMQYKLPFERILTLVKPIRDVDNRDSRRERYWQYAERSPGLFEKLKATEKCMVTAVTSKYLNFSIASSKYIFTEALFVIPKFDSLMYSVLQSNIHEVWVRKYSSSLSTTLRYGAKTCFNNFPFLNIETFNTSYINVYDTMRTEYMHTNSIGLTDFCNRLHDKNNEEPFFNEFKKILIDLDNEVVKLYSLTSIKLRHDFYEVDYLPENDRVRFTIHPDAKKEVLKRLLELNHKIHEEEVKNGLWEKKAKGKKYKSNEEEISALNEKEIDYGLFKKDNK